MLSPKIIVAPALTAEKAGHIENRQASHDEERSVSGVRAYTLCQRCLESEGAFGRMTGDGDLSLLGKGHGAFERFERGSRCGLSLGI